MRPIEPGESFTITYGNGRTIELKALSKRHEIALSKIESEPTDQTSIEMAYDRLERTLHLFLPDMQLDDIKAMTDGMNLPLLQELTTKAVGTTHISEDDAKKSE